MKAPINLMLRMGTQFMCMFNWVWLLIMQTSFSQYNVFYLVFDTFNLLSGISPAGLGWLEHPPCPSQPLQPTRHPTTYNASQPAISLSPHIYIYIYPWIYNHNGGYSHDSFLKFSCSLQVLLAIGSQVAASLSFSMLFCRCQPPLGPLHIT